MALVPIIGYEVQNCENLLIIDETVYGGDEPDRSDCVVNISIVYYPSTGPVLYELSYDPALVEQVAVPLKGDGWYKISLTIQNNAAWLEIPEPAFKYSEELNLVIYCQLQECYLSNVNEFIRNRCRCMNAAADKLIRDIRLGLVAIELKTEEQGDYAGAVCIIEELLSRCHSTKPCGCG